ncbi:hypothetical protein R3P38DRAFT_1189516 [Favolaschia claudopus]|uniref:F-box domain-containing protein n=1 Tax=Favolaschia claudopus TaxID=2862362 RepID=A0AAW0E301_9AGAR
MSSSPGSPSIDDDQSDLRRVGDSSPLLVEDDWDYEDVLAQTTEHTHRALRWREGSEENVDFTDFLGPSTSMEETNSYSYHSLLVGLRASLREARNIPIEAFERGLIALDTLEEVFRLNNRNAYSSRAQDHGDTGPELESEYEVSRIEEGLPVFPAAGIDSAEADSVNGIDASIDAIVLRRHHATMAKRVAEIDCEMATIDAKLESLRPPVLQAAIAEARRQEEIQARLQSEARARCRQLEVQRADDSKVAKDKKELNIRHRDLLLLRKTYTYIVTPEAYRSAPIRRIPDDILLEILLAVKSDEPTRVGSRDDWWVLMEVCSRWRHAVCSHPRFWSTFTLPLFGKESSVNLLRVALERCRTSTLSVVVLNNSAQFASLEGGYAIAKRKLSLLTERAEKITNLRFRGQQNIHPLPSFSAFRNRLPHLELLGFTHLWPLFADAFSSAPSLRTLELDRSADLLEMKIPLPIAQIAHIRFNQSASGFNLSPVHDALSMVTIQTEPSYPVVSTTTVRPRQPPALKQLTTWRVEFPAQQRRETPWYQIEHPPPPPPDTAVNFFARFHTPALRSLHLTRLSNVQGVVDLLKRSVCPLMELVVEEASFSGGDLGKLLRAVPTLCRLDVVSGCVELLDDDILRELGGAEVVPCLTELRVDGSYNFSTDSLVRMVQDRCRPATIAVKQLTRLDLTLRDRVMSKEEEQVLRGLEGLHFTATTTVME